MINTDWASPLGSLPIPQPTLGGVPIGSLMQGGFQNPYGALVSPSMGAQTPPPQVAPAGTSTSEFGQLDQMPTTAPMPTPRPSGLGAYQAATTAPSFGATAPMPTPRPQDLGGAPQAPQGMQGSLMGTDGSEAPSAQASAMFGQPQGLQTGMGGGSPLDATAMASQATPSTGPASGVNSFLDRLKANAKSAKYQLVRPNSIFGQLGQMGNGQPAAQGSGPLSILLKSIFNS